MFGDVIFCLIVYFREMRWFWGKDNNLELILYGNKSFLFWSVEKRCLLCMVNFFFIENGIEKI